MRRFRIIAISAIVFGSIGPMIGGTLVFISRGGDYSTRLIPLSYVFGLIPALLAGITFGVMRLRAHDQPFPWHGRVIRGAFAGLIGSLVFVVLGAIYTLT